MISQDGRRVASRREFAKLLGLGAAASAVATPALAPAQATDAELDALVALATEGSAARLDAAELAELKKAVQEDRKALALIREFKVGAAFQPVLVFRPREPAAR
jgi:hypothetical protein